MRAILPITFDLAGRCDSIFAIFFCVVDCFDGSFFFFKSFLLEWLSIKRSRYKQIEKKPKQQQIDRNEQHEGAKERKAS